MCVITILDLSSGGEPERACIAANRATNRAMDRAMNRATNRAMDRAMN